jgi:HSP90 family molecular chaperone
VGKVEENDPLVLIGFNLNVDLSYLTFSGDKNEEKEKNMKQEFGQTCDWIKKRLGDKVASVQISNRLSSSPCVLVSGKFGWSANMER